MWRLYGLHLRTYYYISQFKKLKNDRPKTKKRQKIKQEKNQNPANLLLSSNSILIENAPVYLFGASFIALATAFQAGLILY